MGAKGVFVGGIEVAVDAKDVFVGGIEVAVAVGGGSPGPQPARTTAITTNTVSLLMGLPSFERNGRWFIKPKARSMNSAKRYVRSVEWSAA